MSLEKELGSVVVERPSESSTESVFPVSYSVKEIDEGESYRFDLTPGKGTKFVLFSYSTKETKLEGDEVSYTARVMHDLVSRPRSCVDEDGREREYFHSEMFKGMFGRFLDRYDLPGLDKVENSKYDSIEKKVGECFKEIGSSHCPSGYYGEGTPIDLGDTYDLRSGEERKGFDKDYALDGITVEASIADAGYMDFDPEVKEIRVYRKSAKFGGCESRVEEGFMKKLIGEMGEGYSAVVEGIQR